MRRFLFFIFLFHINLLGYSQTSGRCDTTFKNNLLRGEINSVTVLPKKDSIVVGGQLSSIYGDASQNLVLFDKNAKFLRFFNVGAGATNTVLKTSSGSNDTIVAVGKFRYVNKKESRGIAVFSYNGASSFFPISGADNDVLTVSANSVDRIFFGGKFGRFNRKERIRIGAVSYDGASYDYFNPSLKVLGEVNCILETVSELYVGGQFSGIQLGKNGAYPHKNLARINKNGRKIDENFSKNGPSGKVRKMCFQGNKILVMGDFRSYNSGRKMGMRVAQLVRINANTGEIDSSFKIGNLDINGRINDVLIHPSDGKILICGAFTNVQGVTCNRIARLNKDGTVDTTFDSTIGASDEIRSMAIQSNGKIIIGGIFQTYDNVVCNGFARVIY